MSTQPNVRGADADTKKYHYVAAGGSDANMRAASEASLLERGYEPEPGNVYLLDAPGMPVFRISRKTYDKRLSDREAAGRERQEAIAGPKSFGVPTSHKERVKAREAKMARAHRPIPDLPQTATPSKPAKPSKPAPGKKVHTASGK